jgi:DnaJ-class molecular chaperone
MSEKLPAPCERCNASGLFHGISCEECQGKGYRLIIDSLARNERPQRATRPPRQTN